jgi:DNA-binding MarR family transcriptional regulator
VSERSEPGPDMTPPLGPQDGPPSGLDHSALRQVLGYQLSLADIPSKKLYFKHIGERFRLRPVEYSLLVLVMTNRDVTQKQLGQALSLSAPNLTLLLDKLAERGLLLRERSEIDRRVQHVRLTPEGEALTQQAHACVPAMEREWLKFLTEAEKAMLSELLQKMARHRRV